MADRFKIRFMRPDEAGRLAKLVEALQNYQQLRGVYRIPNEEDVKHELTRAKDSKTILGNNRGSFVALAIDTNKLEDVQNKSYIVGYIMYTQNYSIIDGRQIYLNSLFIEEDFRFHGLGRKLIDFMRNHAELFGNSRFDVPFMLKNSIGIKFYGKMGAYSVSDKYKLAHFDLESIKRIANV